MGSITPDLVDRAAEQRLRMLELFRGPNGAVMVGEFLRRGDDLVRPAKWRSLPIQEQAARFAAAEARRIADARLFALDGQIAEAARTVAAEPVPLRLPSTLLPAPTGMIVFSEPVAVSSDGGIITAATWGPLPEGTADGVQLTIWTDHRLHAEQDNGPGGILTPRQQTIVERAPLLFHFDFTLPFHPAIDGRLMPGVPMAEDWATNAPALRAIVAAWYALSHSLVDTKELRPSATTSRALATAKARHRGVQYATVDDARTTADAIAEAARTTNEELGANLSYTLGEFAGLAQNQLQGIDPVFASDRDAELPQEARWLPTLYRAAALPMQQLELECEELYPGVFGALEEIRVRKAGQWPYWCWMPITQVAAALIEVYRAEKSDQLVIDAEAIAGLGAWRSSGRHALALDWVPSTKQNPLAPSQHAGRWPVPAVTLVHLNDDRVYTGDLLAYLNVPIYEEAEAELRLINVQARDATMQLLLTGESLEDATATTARISLNPPGPDGKPMTDAEVAQAIGDTYRPYLPILSRLAVPDPDVLDIAEAGETLDRREPRTWPPSQDSSHYMTMWLTCPPPPAAG
jgi:hypothetical protein